MVEELIRNYFYTRRDLLSDALNFLEIEHDGGLTDADLAFVEDLDSEKGKMLKNSLREKHDKNDVELYLVFMNIDH